MTHQESRARNALVPVLFKKGATAKGIARQLKMRVSYVTAILRQHGYDRIDYDRRSRDAEIRRLRRDGWDVATVAKCFDITPARVSQIAGRVRVKRIAARLAVSA